MRKIKLFLLFLCVFTLPGAIFAAGLDSVKADFLQGNYRRVIFEAGPQSGHFSIQWADELEYLLGLSYLKEGRLDSAQECFRSIINNPISKMREAALLSSADADMIRGKFKRPERVYRKILEDNPGTKFKASVLYRLSQLEALKGDKHRCEEYLSKLKREFPLSLDLRQAKGFPVMTELAKQADEFSVQVGFFANISNAVNLKNKLLAADYPAYIEGGSSGYRVKVGKFKERGDALTAENRLSRQGYPTKIVP
jgi:tetratricopeptide (TPR) repeat protein